VVVTAHSQGSLVTVAALIWLNRDERKRVGLVTHGSQLQVAFPRAFPAYVNIDVINQLMKSLDGRWVNLYRETDPVGGPVHSWDHWGTGAQDRSDIADGLHTYRSSTYSSPEERAVDAVYPTGLRVCGHDWRLLDPTPYDDDEEWGPVDRVWAHSRYWRDPAWEYAVNRVGGRHQLRSYPDPSQASAASVDAALPE